MARRGIIGIGAPSPHRRGVERPLKLYEDPSSTRVTGQKRHPRVCFRLCDPAIFGFLALSYFLQAPAALEQVIWMSTTTLDTTALLAVNRHPAPEEVSLGLAAVRPSVVGTQLAVGRTA